MGNVVLVDSGGVLTLDSIVSPTGSAGASEYNSEPAATIPELRFVGAEVVVLSIDACGSRGFTITRIMSIICS